MVSEYGITRNDRRLKILWDNERLYYQTRDCIIKPESGRRAFGRVKLFLFRVLPHYQSPEITLGLLLVVAQDVETNTL